MNGRVQRSRQRGTRLPDGAVYVGRPTKWGNPFTHGPVEQVVAAYRQWLGREIMRGNLDLGELRGKTLACWCPLDQPCHADVLLELANTQVQP
jgi:hypothetical protein